MSEKSRHEAVPLPSGQSSSRPERLVSAEARVSPTQPCPASLSVVCSHLLFSLLSFFRAGFLGVVLKHGCAVATSAMRGLSGVVVPHLLVAVRFPPT